ncbi:MAG TPA: hypothetical protein VH229_02725 [Candidatus Udaeobacter sp.]|nr:hypothetical protein [Candidatus Udaeobacter sp.]
MKERTKMTLRTKIYLTIVMLLSLPGVLYAANPVPFVTPGHGIFQPIGMAADPTHLYASEFEDNQILTIDCQGNATLFGTLPVPTQPLVEKYPALAPAQSATALFTPGDLFVTLREKIYRATPPSGIFTQFADLSGVLGGCPLSDHSAIGFDKVGTFGFNMIVTCENGRVWKIDHLGNVTHIADTTDLQHLTHIEGPVVLPSSFGPLGGKILVADDQFNQVYAIDNMGNVTYNPFNLPDPTVFTLAEQILVIPEFPCTYCDRAFFQASAQNDTIFSYPLSDFTGFGGDILITTEGAPPQGTVRSHFNSTTMAYEFSIFDASAILNEGATFVEGICSPTPTPTPSPSPSPTPTPTVTPTTCGTAFVIGDLDAVVGNTVTFWGAQWWKKNHLSGGTAPASFKGFANCTNPNPPACGGTWISDPGNSSHPPDTVPADITVIVSSLITKSGSIESGDIPMMVTIHTNPGYDGNPGHAGTGTVTAVVCQGARPHQPVRPARTPR